MSKLSQCKTRFMSTSPSHPLLKLIAFFLFSLYSTPSFAEEYSVYLVDRDPGEGYVGPHTRNLIGLKYSEKWVWDTINQGGAFYVRNVSTTKQTVDQGTLIETLFYKEYEIHENDEPTLLLEPTRTIYRSNSNNVIFGHSLFEVIPLDGKTEALRKNYRKVNLPFGEKKLSLVNSTQPKHENEYYVLYDERYVLAEIFLEPRHAFEEITRGHPFFIEQINFIKKREQRSP